MGVVCVALFLGAIVLEPSRVPEVKTVVVVDVVDGDTIKVRGVDGVYRVRLEGVDAPEKRQADGLAASAWLKGKIGGAEVTVHAKGRGRYGRVVGDVTLADGECVNVSLVRAGWAWWYRQYDRSDDRLRQAESAARVDKVGLWAKTNPIPPWMFRAQRTRGPGR